MSILVRRAACLVAALILGSIPAQAQPVLTLDEALHLGLENNLGVEVARHEAAIARNDRSLGHAGFLPTVDVLAFREDVREGSGPVGAPRALGNESSTAVETALRWTIFDGLRMFATYNRLSEEAQLGLVFLGMVAENTVVDVIRNYYDIARVEQRLEALRSTVETSEERLRIVQNMFDLGSGSEYDVLLAWADLNADRAAVVREQGALEASRMALTETLNLPPDQFFVVESDIVPTGLPPLEELEDDLERQNLQLEAMRLSANVTGHQLSEIRRGWLPEIELNAGHRLGREDDFVQAVDPMAHHGFRYGLTARFRLFDGFNTRRQIQNATIVHQNERLRLEEERLALLTSLHREHANFENANTLVDLETENVDIAERAVLIALERFTLGTTTALELRENQRILLDAETRLIEAQFEAKVAETELRRLAARLPIGGLRPE